VQIQLLEKSLNLIPIIDSNSQLIQHLDRFFSICQKTNKNDIVKVKTIRDKCCLLENNEEIFISIYSDVIKN